MKVRKVKENWKRRTTTKKRMKKRKKREKEKQKEKQKEKMTAIPEILP